MKLPVIISALVVAMTLTVTSATQEEVAALQRSKDELTIKEWQLKLETLGPADESNLTEMGRLLARLGDSKKFPDHRQEADTMFREVQNRILSFPDHAAFFEQPLAEQRQMVLEGRMPWSGYHTNSEQGFRIFSNLPSPEVMGVLGRMLDDTKGMSPEDAFPTQARESFQNYGSNAEMAARSLREIGIADPPDFGPWKNDWDRIRFWRDWWQEVKDGKRTYRFIGSNVEYGYDGPLAKESSRRPRDSKNHAAGVSSGEEEPSVKSKGPVHYGIIASAVLLALASVFFAFRKLKRAN